MGISLQDIPSNYNMRQSFDPEQVPAPEAESGRHHWVAPSQKELCAVTSSVRITAEIRLVSLHSSVLLFSLASAHKSSMTLTFAPCSLPHSRKEVIKWVRVLSVD